MLIRKEQIESEIVVHELPNGSIYAWVGVGWAGWGRRDGRVGVWMGGGR